MMKRTGLLMLTLGILLFGLVNMLYAKGPEGGDSQKGRLAKVSTNDVYRIFLINNTTNYYSNNGDGCFNPFSQDDEGFEFPKGSNHFCIFESGLVWGGFQKRWDETKATLKVGGSTYYHGIQAGKILTPGTATTAPVAEAAGLAKNRIFRVRPDIKPSLPFSAVQQLIEQTELPFIQYETYTAQQIYDQYVKDWNEWPATDGAPYTDVNHNGVYDPSVDIPGVPGADQTLWYVANDMDETRATAMYGSRPIGIEMQKTIWGYNVSGALANTIFERNLVINKSGSRIDSMFFTQWSDPDLGGSGSANLNAAGCDTVLGVGFVYMATPSDPTYGSAAPSAGFDFLQGPVVAGAPTDVAIFQGRTIKGKKNLNMTGFNFFINSNAAYGDPTHPSYNGTVQWYNLMNGLVGSTGAAFINPVTGRYTTFLLSGDPVTSSGWLYKQVNSPADVRMCQTTGPFSMAPGDTQEVVVGMLASQGADHFSSISKLKFDDRAIKAAYAFNFDLANPPPAPVVTVTQMDGSIVLDWSNPTTSAATETYTKKGYNFEGYNVYQIPGKSFNNPVRLATYDVVDAVGVIQDLTYDNASGTTLVKAVQFGGDTGIQRYFTTTQDAIRQVNLVNGNSYYYAVTAYSYNGSAEAGQLTLESPPQVLEVIPQVPFGTQLRAVAGDTIGAVHTAGISTGTATVSVINPAALTGDVYQIQGVNGPPITLILSTGDTLKAFSLKFQLVDVTKGNAIVAPPTGNFGIDHTNQTVDGVQFGLNAVPHYVEGQEVASYKYPTGFGAVNQLAPYVGGSGFFPGSLKPYQVTKSVEVDFLGTPKSGAAGQKAYCFLRNASSGGSPYVGYFPQPFTVWDITTVPRRQIDMVFLEQVGQPTLDSVWDIGTSSAAREYMWIVDQDYTPTAKAIYSGAANTVNGLANVPVLYAFWITAPAVPYHAGDKMIINVSVPLGTTDVWTFTTNGRQPVKSSDLQKSSAQTISVWPNPYFGFNKNELNKYQRFVQIDHLPARATIRVFNLAGILIRTLSKNDNSQFSRWDLNNESGLPVAAGMYILYIDMPDLGTTKTLKMAVIPETQFLDRY